MNAETKEKAGLIFNITESVVVAIMVYMTTKIMANQIQHGEELAAHRTQLAISTGRIETIDTKGSRAVESMGSEISNINKQMIEMRTAIITLQTAPGELKAMNVRLENLVEGQKRIERQLEEHRNNEIK